MYSVTSGTISSAVNWSRATRDIEKWWRDTAHPYYVISIVRHHYFWLLRWSLLVLIFSVLGDYSFWNIFFTFKIILTLIVICQGSHLKTGFGDTNHLESYFILKADNKQVRIVHINNLLTRLEASWGGGAMTMPSCTVIYQKVRNLYLPNKWLI